MREMLVDVLKHVGAIADFEYAKFIVKDHTDIEAMDDERNIILKCRTKKHYPQLHGEFGMQRFPILKGFLDFANYKSDLATIEVKHKQFDEEDSAPEELVFRDENGQKSIYRFMAADLLPDQAKFVGADWVIDILANRTKMLEFTQLASILSHYEKYFLVSLKQGQLMFYIGEEDATTDRTSVTIANNIDVQLKAGMYFNSTIVSTLVKLGLDENLKLKFTNKGAMMLSMESEQADYDFILPAHYK
jgi:hypothetical protein